jgi:hypothetical protein
VLPKECGGVASGDATACALPIAISETDIEGLTRLGLLPAEMRNDLSAVISALYRHLDRTLGATALRATNATTDRLQKSGLMDTRADLLKLPSCHSSGSLPFQTEAHPNLVPAHSIRATA